MERVFLFFNNTSDNQNRWKEYVPLTHRAQWFRRKTLSWYICNKQFLFIDGEKNEQQSSEGKYGRKCISRKEDLCLWMGPISFIHGFCFATWSTPALPHFLITKACFWVHRLSQLFETSSANKPGNRQDFQNLWLRLSCAGVGQDLGGREVQHYDLHLGHPYTLPIVLWGKWVYERKDPTVGWWWK